ncbi:major facilitator superfamily domain-containing protein [Thelonectria olida]|uniref:Major facilitator superfamily domain-containing protein n=1 Tax=Thelonectria olida TaxID=1576542 RepID=A0A9P8W567_9HYPO|nr:major facilitator superfamily domain-containing protein [Thelonectria olida]
MTITHLEPTPMQSSQSPPRIDVTDAESQSRNPIASHFRLIIDQSGVCQSVISQEYSGAGTPDDPFVVDFLEHDARNPRTFSQTRKWTITLLQAMSAFTVAFVSTAYSGGIADIRETFGVSSEVGLLGLSLFVLGFALGPLLWAPLSELFGRRYLFISTYAVLVALNAGTVFVQNIQSLIVLRFLAGTIGSSPLTNAGAVISDMFTPAERGRATTLFAAAPFLGPSIGPIVSGFLGATAGWRWIEGLMAIMTGVLLIICCLSVPETYSPVLLRRRAEFLRKGTGKYYVSKFERHKGQQTMKQRYKVALCRPWVLLFTEPIVLMSSTYVAIVYGTLYMLFAAYPIVYQKHRGWSPGEGGLAFLGVIAGMALAIIYTLFEHGRYTRILVSEGSASPETRLPPSMIGAVLLPIGLFWFAWTNGPEIHWIVSITASSFFAAGLVLVFLSLLNYLIDSYTIFAASALAANSVLRSLLGAAFPLFSTKMYDGLGIHWASSVPGFLALACLPFPFVFYRYGARIRSKCAMSSEAQQYQ